MSTSATSGGSSATTRSRPCADSATGSPPTSCGHRRDGEPALAERERVRAYLRIEELDLERVRGHPARLPDELVQALIRDGAVALLVHVPAVRPARRLAVQRDAESRR